MKSSMKEPLKIFSAVSRSGQNKKNKNLLRKGLHCKERLRELRLLSLENRRHRDILSTCINSQWKGMKRRVRLFYIVPSSMTRGVKVVKSGDRLPREVLQSPSVDVHKTQLAICSKWLFLSKRVGPGGL